MNSLMDEIENLETRRLHQEDEECQAEAYRRYELGITPSYSTFIDEITITAGYGELDRVGSFEFPLMVDQETLKIIPLMRE